MKIQTLPIIASLFISSISFAEELQPTWMCGNEQGDTLIIYNNQTSDLSINSIEGVSLKEKVQLSEPKYRPGPYNPSMPYTLLEGGNKTIHVKLKSRGRFGVETVYVEVLEKTIGMTCGALPGLPSQPTPTE